MAVGAVGLLLDQIVNVHWGGRVTGLIDQFMQQTPKWLLSFALEVRTEQNTSGDETHKLTVPKFGNKQELPTTTQSLDQTWTIAGSEPHIISGGTVTYSTPRFLLYNWKGFIIFQNTTLKPGPTGPLGEKTVIEVIVPNSYTCFDSKGKKTTVEKLPKEESKGVAIASATDPDTPGTWYMSVDKGLRKFDSDGNLMMTIGAPNSSTNPFPDTVIFDSARNQMRLIWFSNGPGADFGGQGEIAWYDLDGAKQEIKLIGGDNFGGSDCSRNGRIYGLLAQGGGTDDDGVITEPVFSIDAYDYDGSKLFSIDPIGGFNDVNNEAEVFSNVVCYGEDYIIARTFKKTESVINLGTQRDGSALLNFVITNQQRRIVYDAKTGAKVDEHDYGEMRGDNIQKGFETIQTTSAYNIDRFIIRNDYFPRVEFKLPKDPTAPGA